MNTITRILLIASCLAANVGILRSQWAQTSGPMWNDIYCLSAEDSTIFAGTDRGVFSMKNDGTMWSALNDGMTTERINAITITGRFLLAGTQFNGMYRSSDKGEHWAVVNTGLGNHQVFSMVTAGGYIYAGTYGGVYRSADSGATWTTASTGLTITFVQSLASNGQYIFAGTDGGGVFRSSNNGASWQPVNTGLTGHDVCALAVSGTKIFAGTYGDSLFVSTDNGATWSPANTGLTDGNIFALAVSGTTLFAGTYGGVFRSADNGSTWEAVNTGLERGYINAITVSGGYTFASSSGDIYRLSVGGSIWQRVNYNLASEGVSSLLVSGTKMIAGTYKRGVARSFDRGVSWQPANSGLTNANIRTLVSSGGYVYAGTAGGIFRSTDTAATWSAVNAGLSRPAVNILFTSGTKLFAGTDSGIFISTNNGTNWSPINTGLTTNTGAIPAVNAFAVFGDNLFAGTSAGVYRSTDSSSQWTPVSSSIQIDGGYTFSITALAVHRGSLYAGILTTFHRAEIYRSGDNGATWTKVSSGLAGGGITAFYNRDTSLYVGTENGIFLLASNDTSWLNIGSGLGDGTTSLAASETDLFAGSSRRGVWTRALSSLSLPTPPVLISPADGSTDIPVESFEFSWSSSGAGTIYRLQVSLDSTFKTTVCDISWIYYQNYLMYGLVKNKMYYWRVMAGNDIGTSAWSKTQSFSTIGFGTPVVHLASPQNGSITTADNIKLVWHKCTAPVLWYEVRLFAQNYLTYTETYDTTFTFYVPSSLSDKVYSWKVRAKTDTGYANYSDVWTFTKSMTFVSDSGSAVNRIELVSPLNGSQMAGGDSIRFIWKRSPVPSTSYILDLWSDRYDQIESIDTTFKFALPVQSAKTFSWRIRAKNDTGSYSGLWTFTKLPTAVAEEEVIPVEYALFNNYPNPFNPSTTFSFALPNASFVRLSIFDALGREAASVVHEELPAGRYTRQWNAAGLPSGVYFYRLQAGSFTATRKLILLR